MESLLRLGRPKLTTSVTIYTHSSITEKYPHLSSFCSEFSNVRDNSDLRIDFIWKTVGLDPLLKAAGVRDLSGEVNIARYINRLVEARSPETLRYESRGPEYANKVDYALDKIHAILHGVDNRKLASLRGSGKRYCLNELSIVDLILDADRPIFNNR